MAASTLLTAPAALRRTKIVATLGPATDAPGVLEQLFAAGVDVFRMNASHGNQEDHRRRIHAVREGAAQTGKQVGILLDLQGPKIRLGKFADGRVTLATGSDFTITTQEVLGTAERASTSYANFAKDVQSGDSVLLADGSIELRVRWADDLSATCEVISGGPISDNKGINLPGVHVSAPSLTKKDVADLRFGIEMGVDFVALSFVRKRDDLLRLRAHLEDHEVRIPIIAKIEKPEGYENLAEILKESDGVMVARGDLGVEMALERVPLIQKEIIEQARQHGKFVITATQMLESMIEHSYPTRAEVSDIANAIYDGTDAVMLSAETSAGKYPVESVRMMARIAHETDLSLHPRVHRELDHPDLSTTSEIIADSAYRATRMADASAIALLTASGQTARTVARYRPAVPIYAFTANDSVARQLSVVYGVHASPLPEQQTVDGAVQYVDGVLLERSLVKKRDLILFLAGQPIGRSGSTNLMKLHRVGEVH